MFLLYRANYRRVDDVMKTIEDIFHELERIESSFHHDMRRNPWMHSDIPDNVDWLSRVITQMYEIMNLEKSGETK